MCVSTVPVTLTSVTWFNFHQNTWGKYCFPDTGQAGSELLSGSFPEGQGFEVVDGHINNVSQVWKYEKGSLEVETWLRFQKMLVEPQCL